MIALLNHLGDTALYFAWPMVWQSSLLIAVLFTLDFALRRKVRAAVRYSLWLVVLVKLVVPPSLALPTGLAWWLRPTSTLPLPPAPRQFVVSYSDESLPMDAYVPVVAAPVRALVPRISLTAIGLVASGGVSLVLFGFLVWRWFQVARQIRNSEEPSDELRELFVATAREAGVRGRVRLRLTSGSVSPAVCGLVRPCVVLPRALVEKFVDGVGTEDQEIPPHPGPLPKERENPRQTVCEPQVQGCNARTASAESLPLGLREGESSPRPGDNGLTSPAQLRAVLLHELMHVRRADVWVNCAQTLLQIVYWWHPLLWFTNARIRRLREEAVDDAVMMALREDAEVYAPTLLEVAKLAFHRPLASLGLVGILESKRALSRRIERLLDFQPPRRAGLSFVSVLGVAAFTCMAVPQGEAPPKIERALLQSSSPSYARVNREDQWTHLGETDGWERLRFPGTKEDMPWPAFIVRPGNDLGQMAAEKAGAKRLDRVWLGRASFDNLPLRDVIRILNEESQKHDPDGERIKFLTDDAGHEVDPMSGLSRPSEGQDLGAININVIPVFRDVRLKELLDSIVKSANPSDGLQVRYAAFNSSVIFSRISRKGAEILARAFKFDPNTLMQGSQRSVKKTRESDDRASDAHAAQDTTAGQVVRISAARKEVVASALRAFFQSRGVDLALPKAVFWHENDSTLLVRATKGELDVIESGLADFYGALPASVDDHTSNHGVVLTEDRVTLTANRVTVDPLKREISAEGDVKIRQSDANGVPAPLAVPTNWARNTRVEASKNRQRIFDWLRGAPLERASFGDVPLSDVITVLKEETRKLNPDTHGINFIYAPNAEAIDVAAVRIKNLQVLTNISLYKNLNAVVSHADTPIKFTVEDFGVVFSTKFGNPIELITRSFHLDPTTFRERSERAIGVAPGTFGAANSSKASERAESGERDINGIRTYVASTNEMAFSAALRDFFRSRGVNLSPPKNVFWRDRGDLLVRATAEDLDKIETELAVLNAHPEIPDANEKSTTLIREAAELIEAQRYEEAAVKLKEAIKLNPTNRQAFRYANVIYEHGDPQARKILSINTNSETQINIHVKLVAIPKKASAAFWKGLAATNSPSGPDGIILSSTQSMEALKFLKSQKGVEVLSEPQVTTLSGRQARIQVGQVQPILMGVTNGDKEPHYNMTNFFAGQEVDLIAYAKPDSGAIQLTATNALKEFLGYDDPGKERVEVLVGGKPTRVKPPLPRFREHDLAINATVLDGQTLVLGRPQITETVNNKAAKPVARKEAERKDLVVFITPTLIDAEGNPLRK